MKIFSIGSVYDFIAKYHTRPGLVRMNGVLLFYHTHRDVFSGKKMLRFYNLSFYIYHFSWRLGTYYTYYTPRLC